MRKTETSIEAYRRRIISIVCLTNIPALLFLPTMYSQAIGWIAGTIASSANFYWMSCKVSRMISSESNNSKLAGYKLFYLRFLFLAVYSVLIVLLLKPDILIYGAGLVSVQLAIYGNHFYEMIREKREADDTEQTEPSVDNPE